MRVSFVFAGIFVIIVMIFLLAKFGRESLGRASRVPPFGFEKAAPFCFGALGGNRTPI